MEFISTSRVIEWKQSDKCADAQCANIWTWLANFYRRTPTKQHIESSPLVLSFAFSARFSHASSSTLRPAISRWNLGSRLSQDPFRCSGFGQSMLQPASWILALKFFGEAALRLLSLSPYAAMHEFVYAKLPPCSECRSKHSISLLNALLHFFNSKRNNVRGAAHDYLHYYIIHRAYWYAMRRGKSKEYSLAAFP